MWYLITFEDASFVRVTIDYGEIESSYEGSEDGKPIFSLSQNEKYYSLEVLDDCPDCVILTELNKLNRQKFIFLNHATCILKWEEGLDSLKNSLMKIFAAMDKYAIFPISEIAASNFLPVDGINQMLMVKKI